MNPPRPGSSATDDLFLGLQAALAGEYSIERELGRGGMGVVYLAREVRLAREVAIKVLPPALARDPERRAQFLREAQMAAGLSHPNIVPIHRVDETRGFVYFVMAYIAGETLAERIAQRGPLAPHQAGRVLREVAWALTYAHSNSLVHRDVKADNILLERATERALVTDFGIANLANADARASDGHIAGSPHYASPEQIAGQPVDAASDLYSLGVVGFLALTGRLPFDAPTTREVVAMHLNARTPSIVSLAPTVPPKLAQLVERCLVKRADGRPASAAVFAEALEQAIEPPREIPTPIRVWLTRTNRTGIVRPLILGYLALSAMTALLATGVPTGLVVAGGLVVTVAAFLPAWARTNRVLAAGYGIEDLRIAIREYWVRRREEMAYEVSSSLSTRAALVVFGAAVTGAVLLRWSAGFEYGSWAIPVFGLLTVGSVFAGIVLAARLFRAKFNAQLGSSQIRFYNSKWGERFVRLAGLGLKKRTPSESLSQHTEVALGRATDALYDALPKPLKKQLALLPPTVRRLEEDAKKLRAEIDRLDESLIALEADATMPSALAASAHESRIRADRDRLHADLRTTRTHASDRLAATVAALENIRLDLLRLQLGDGRVESVTASLEAAREVGADLDAYVSATEEVERVLRHPSLAPRTSVP
jgi:tRNA A-37 threonylcarbamoyl transferase component Bud32